MLHQPEAFPTEQPSNRATQMTQTNPIQVPSTQRIQYLEAFRTELELCIWSYETLRNLAKSELCSSRYKYNSDIFEADIDTIACNINTLNNLYDTIDSSLTRCANADEIETSEFELLSDMKNDVKKIMAMAKQSQDVRNNNNNS